MMTKKGLLKGKLRHIKVVFFSPNSSFEHTSIGIGHHLVVEGGQQPPLRGGRVEVFMEKTWTESKESSDWL